VAELKQEILAKMKGSALWALATVTEEGKPWVRYVTPTRIDDDLTVWCATFIGSRKVAQIRRLPEVHLTAGVTALDTAESYLQIQGRAEILTDASTRRAVWNDRLSAVFSGPDDPQYAVCKVRPYRIEYQTMAPVPPRVWAA